ncbi:MAG TPA: hypothetical protein VNN62_16150 [Methylomirabilota bacterium]|nr:hypothetical protein [Methylomirabilota bacterium]
MKRYGNENLSRRHQRQPPLWLRRLDMVKAELKTVRFPKTAAEGFRQCVMLSETARRWFLDSIRQEHPGWSEEQIEQERRLLLTRFSAAETQWIAKWKKECDRYFRG